MSPSDDMLLPLREAARRFGIAVRTYYRWMEEGRVPRIIKIGRRSLVPLSTVNDTIARMKAGHSS